MSNRRVRAAKSRSEPYVPLDLCSDILSRLPVKSLLRFRCVSKSWRSLIDDPQFCYLHSNSFKNNSHETRLLILQKKFPSYSLRSLIVCRQTLEKTKWISALAGMDTEKAEGWYVRFSIDGLVLLLNKRNAEMLWNPSIRRCRRIPHLRPLDEHGQIGIGFDPVTKDYKYVKTFYRNTRRRVAVYSVRTNSWKTCRVRAREDLSWNPDSDMPVNFRGSLYNTRKRKLLVAFSLSTKVFTYKSLPLAMSDKRICLKLALVDGGSSLAAIGHSWHGPGDCIIWALETDSTNSKSGGGAVSVCWAKRYPITMDFDRLLFFPKSGGDVVFQRRYRVIGVSRSKVELVSYNIETQELRILQRKCSVWTSYAAVYKESLFLLN